MSIPNAASGLAFLLATPLFDEAFYSRSFGQNFSSRLEAAQHYLTLGERLGLKPNFLFDPAWYLTQTGAMNAASNLLQHYYEIGENLGLQPSTLFDPAWFRGVYNVSEGTNCLEVYIVGSPAKPMRPNAYFDPEYYLEHYPDLRNATIDLYEHFVTRGVFEGRRPSATFDTMYVRSRHLNGSTDKNPFLIFLQYGSQLGWSPSRPLAHETAHSQAAASARPSAVFEAEPVDFGYVRRAHVIAFYLPQFHTIPENDQWWGPGFTEWTNLGRGMPRFRGHYQPRIPRDLGFYSLLDSSTIRRQVAMAKRAGIHGFCYYYYNFSGRRLLERPLDLFVSGSDVDFPFCLMWANENWTKRWDGMDNEVLIAQSYAPDQEPALVADIASYMRHSNYITIGGRPLLFVYRSDVIPNTRVTLERLRALFRDEHSIDPFVVMAQTFGNLDPRVDGFDAALEFPPHKFGNNLPSIEGRLEFFDDGFSGSVRSYDDLVALSLAETAPYPLIKTVAPSWDNDSRRPGAGMIIHGSTPEKFGKWCNEIIDRLSNADPDNIGIFCVNAWNEWCESAYLEPDLHYGYAYLNALARAIGGVGAARKPKLLLVGHDAFPAGAQQLLLQIGRTLTRRFGIEIRFLLLGGGGLLQQYNQVAPTSLHEAGTDFWPTILKEIVALRRAGFKRAIVNSAFAGEITEVLRRAGMSQVALVHEMSRIILANHKALAYQRLCKHCDHVVYPALFVQSDLARTFPGTEAQASHILPQGLYRDMTHINAVESRRDWRARLGLALDARVVVNLGYGDLRKGLDLFVETAAAMRRMAPDIIFVWVGHIDPTLEVWLASPAHRVLPDNLRLLPFTDEVGEALCGADLFFLTSREDPFPSVILEALACGLPVISFEDSGGCSQLVQQDPRLGETVPAFDVLVAAERILQMLSSGQSRDADRQYRRSVISKQFNFDTYVFSLLSLRKDIQTVSVVVPNFNYARYLEERLRSIFHQTYPIFEIIVLDDASTDDSVATLETLAESSGRDFTLVENSVNSGSVFSQWRKGVELARGDLVWIAEADDLAVASFLEVLVRMLDEHDVLFAFCDSASVDGSGAPLMPSYKAYYRSLGADVLQSTCAFDSAEFLTRCMSVKNTILNASSVVWRRSVLLRALESCGEELRGFRVAGDWRVYAEACRIPGRVRYAGHPLNIHRRHSRSVTSTLDKRRQLEEIVRMHDVVRRILGSDTSVALQREYVDEIAKQFEVMSPAERPGLSR